MQIFDDHQAVYGHLVKEHGGFFDAGEGFVLEDEVQPVVPENIAAVAAQLQARERARLARLEGEVRQVADAD